MTYYEDIDRDEQEILQREYEQIENERDELLDEQNELREIIQQFKKAWDENRLYCIDVPTSEEIKHLFEKAK